MSDSHLISNLQILFLSLLLFSSLNLPLSLYFSIYLFLSLSQYLCHLLLSQLKAFNSIKTSSGTTQAAVFEYEDSTSADGAVSGLDKLEIADHKLSVHRVPPHAAALLLLPSVMPVIAPPLRKPPPPVETKDPLSELPPTSVIRLSNMTTPKELSNDEEYMELQEDVAEECNVYGVVRSVVIPRGHGQEGEEESDEVGMVYVHFTHSDGASKAKDAIAGRMFNGNIVRATFYPEALFSQQVCIVMFES